LGQGCFPLLIKNDLQLQLDFYGVSRSRSMAVWRRTHP
jgi:hypothetical protein